jgi:CRISPR/Cas system CSM-associated protein Csm3 (group 7 of RAMP superfamily)
MDEERAEKPYDFVPFTGAADQKVRPGHESFRTTTHLSGRLSYRVIVQTPLHISSGSYALTDLDLGLPPKAIIRDCYRVIHEGQELPAIPGSSLKGATRAIVEAVTDSCVAITRVDRRDLPRTASRPCKPPKLCPACGLYGAMSRYARLSFSDALYVEGNLVNLRLPPLYRPRPEMGRLYRDRNRRFIGRKFYYHGRPQKQEQGNVVQALQTRTVLAGDLDFTSLTAAELGLVFFALGLDGSFQLALGGGKPVALGRVKIEAIDLSLRQSASFTEYGTGDAAWHGDSVHDVIADYLRQADSLIHAAARDQLREILDPANQRPAPTGVY